MTYRRANKQCRKVGTSRATGEPLAAMYAGLISNSHGGDPEIYYHFLRSAEDDKALSDRAQELLRDRHAAYDVLWAG